MKFANSSQHFVKDFYAVNESLQGNIDLLFSIKRTYDCEMNLYYEIFVFNSDNNNVITQYQQGGDVVYFTCFEHVALNNDGTITFTRNDLDCAQLEGQTEVIFAIFYADQKAYIQNESYSGFDVNALTYSTAFTASVDESTMTMQILTAAGELLDEVNFKVVSEAVSDVFGAFGVTIIVTGLLQSGSVAACIALRELALPRLQARLLERQQLRHKLRMASMDL